METIHFIILIIVVLAIFYFVFNSNHDNFVNVTNPKLSSTRLPIGIDPIMSITQVACDECLSVDPQKHIDIICPTTCPYQKKCTNAITNNSGIMCS